MSTDPRADQDAPPEASSAALGERFRSAVNRMATPVTVVTSDGTAGRVGVTVSAMSLVSLEPPILLVCIDQRSPANEIVRGNDSFRVNVLGLRHDHVSDTFAGRPWPGKDRWDFTCGDWDLGASGGPRLVDAVASIECEVHSVVSAGSHNIYLGSAVSADETDREPLIYLKRSYCRAVAEPPTTFPGQPDAQPTYAQTRNS